MRILVDITHPAHVHFFRHAIQQWRQRGHSIHVTSRRKDIAATLLDRLHLSHEDLGVARQGLLGLGVELPLRTRKLCRTVRRFRPDVMTAIGGVFIAHAGWLCRVPSVVFYDTENATLSNLLTYPFCSLVVTPRCYEGKVPPRKHRVYTGYHELAYTHPRRFSPDPAVLQAFGLSESDPYIVLRLVSWGAAHDVSDHGFTLLDEAIRVLEPYGRVLISSEAPLDCALEAYRIQGPPENIHHLLSFARLYLGESATMASEAATLGTPAILVSTSVRGYTNEQEQRYGLAFTFSDPANGQASALQKAVEILQDANAKSTWASRRRAMLQDVVDVTDYVVEVVEKAAHSRQRLERTP